ncbi:MAG: leucine-rich repeat protein [Lachnospiraceae bacterium]|nr:leucine-rich repeat protein [Lachnospiraceae bacterium]
MDHRESLPIGYELNLNKEDIEKIVISKEIGRGGNCITYEAKMIKKDTTDPIEENVIVQELYPDEPYINRLPDMNLDITDSKKFERRKKHFDVGIKNHKIFYEYYLDQAIPKISYKGEANNTIYTIKDKVRGEVLSNINFDGKYNNFLNRIASIMEGICKAIGAVHLGKWLYLDCKPQNFYYYFEERDTRIFLFDFDSVIPEINIKNGIYDYASNTPDWAPEEQQLVKDSLDKYKDFQNIGYHTDAYSIGMIFFWLLVKRPATKEDIDKILEGTFDWRRNSIYCCEVSHEIIEMIQSIAKDTLNPSAKIRKEIFPVYTSVGSKLKSRFKELYDYTMIYNNRLDKSQIENTQIISVENMLPRSTNRFKYNSNSTGFKGREKELEILKKMCDREEVFSWIGISGAGGSGKSRLAYELCAEMLGADWYVFAPMNFKKNADKIKEVLKNQNSNLLICLDYIMQDMSDIEDFVLDILDDLNNYSHKIRLVLIERDRNDIYFCDPDINKYNYIYNDKDLNGIIDLKALDDVCLKSIIIDYITKQNNTLDFSQIPVDLIIEKLKDIDIELKRPIFALFIADAWVNNEELTKWDKEDALDYLLKREKDRLHETVKKSGIRLKKDEQQRYIDAIEYLHLIATYIGSVSLSECSDLLYEKFEIDSKDHVLNILLDNFRIITGDGIIEGMEPDLIGEYYCVDYYNKISLEEISKIIDRLVDIDLNAYIRYTEQIYMDYYEDLISDCTWRDLLTCIKIPLKYRIIYRRLFKGKKFLREISLNDRVNTIKTEAFMECENLERIVLPTSVEIIEKNAFRGCKNLKSVKLEKGVGADSSIIRIEKAAFKDCISLTDIVLPYSTQEIGVSAFEGCCALEKIKIPYKLKEIKSYTFYKCSALNKVNIKADNIILRESCFAECENLAEIKNAHEIGMIERDVFRNCKSLKKIKFSYMLHEIMSNAFSGCTALETIDMSECDIKIIPERFFYGCESLSQILLPKEIEEIGDRAFGDCHNILDINIPYGLKIIGIKAFSGCNNLSHLELPQSLEIINKYALEGCSSLESILFHSNKTKVESGVFNGCDKLHLSDISGMDISSGDEFGGFEFSSFSESEFDFLKNYNDQEVVMIPKTVRAICEEAFIGNEKIREVYLPESVKKIGDSAFYSCINLQIVYCVDGTIEYIGKKAFMSCNSLERISGSIDVDNINDETFRNCILLEEIGIKGKLDKIGKKAFKECHNLYSLFIDDKSQLKNIGSGAFSGCERIQYPISIDMIRNCGYKTDELVLNGFLFSEIGYKELRFLDDCWREETIIIPDTCIDIKNVDFSIYNNVRRIVMPDSIKELPNSVFKRCKNLKEVELSHDIKVISYEAFSGCKELEKFCFRGYEPNFIPKGVIIKKAAFYGCSKIKDIKLSEGLKNIEKRTFCNCSSIENLVIPSGVKNIGEAAFCGCRNLKYVKLPESLKRLDSRAFSGCTSLREIEGLENTEIRYICTNTFDSCRELKKIYLPNGLECIWHYAFFGCNSLEVSEDFLPWNLKTIGNAAFQECYSLKSIRIPEKVEYIDNYAFKNCSFLENVIFPKGLKKIGQSSFYNCNRLKNWNLDELNMLKDIGVYAFSYCNSLTRVKIPESVEYLPIGLFEGCNMLEEVIIPDYIEVIANNFFRNCSRLKNVNLPSKLKKISVGSFKGCSELWAAGIKFPDGLSTIDASAFRYCDSIDSIELPKNISTISLSSFEGCRNLRSVKAESTINKVDKYAFYNCTMLEKFPFEKIEGNIDGAAFANCSSLRNIVLSKEHVTSSKNAFEGCPNQLTYE